MPPAFSFLCLCREEQQVIFSGLRPGGSSCAGDRHLAPRACHVRCRPHEEQPGDLGRKHRGEQYIQPPLYPGGECSLLPYPVSGYTDILVMTGFAAGIFGLYLGKQWQTRAWALVLLVAYGIFIAVLYGAG